jgi:hypothetical protein
LVEEERLHADERGLLAAVLRAGGDEHAASFADQGTLLPEPAGGIKEGLHLGRRAAVAGAGAEEKTVGLGEVGRLGDGDVGEGLLGLGGAHLGDDLVGEGFGDLEDFDLGAGDGAGAFGEGFGELIDVAVEAVEDDFDFGAHNGWWIKW